MFPHALDTDGYPREGFLRGSRTKLECYDDGTLDNYGSIKLRIKHYSNESFQDHSFYVVGTNTRKEILVGHPASVRLGLIQVLCKNISKSILSIEKSDSSSRDSFQDHHIRIDGRVPRMSHSSKSSPKSTALRLILDSPEP